MKKSEVAKRVRRGDTPVFTRPSFDSVIKRAKRGAEEKLPLAHENAGQIRFLLAKTGRDTPHNERNSSLGKLEKFDYSGKQSEEILVEVLLELRAVILRSDKSDKVDEYAASSLFAIGVLEKVMKSAGFPTELIRQTFSELSTLSLDRTVYQSLYRKASAE